MCKIYSGFFSSAIFLMACISPVPALTLITPSFTLNSPMAHNGILSPVVTLLVNELWKPIKKHIGYCLKPETYASNLAKAADDLKNSIDTVEETIKLGEYEGKRPKGQATRWIESARPIEAEACSVINNYEARNIHIFGCSWSCWSNYQISKSAAKIKTDVEDMNKRSPQHDHILSLLPQVGMELPLPANVVGQEHYRRKVLDYIEKGTEDIIGICGMGGSGKTTLLKQINNYYCSALERSGFDHVMFIEIGKRLNLMAVQQNIASALGLLLKDGADATHGARAIFNFLKEKKFLLLIDDLWDMLDLVKIGIPHGLTKCGFPNSQVVVITTRSLDICGRMHIFENIVQLKCLNSDQSWYLFKEIVGGRKMEDARIRGCAEKIAAKCGGLPLAIKITGQAMASNVASEEWEYNLMLLQDSNSHQVSAAHNELFPILKISYDSLHSDVIRMCFLLSAAQVGHYDDYPAACLVHIWMGHGLLGEDDDIERTYLSGYSIVEILKRSFLLEASERGEKRVKMHHVVQDLALWIVATKQDRMCKERWLVGQREHIGPDDWSTANRIFLCADEIKTIPSDCSCPNLLTLILSNNKQISESPDGFFSAMKLLVYLDLSGTQIQEIPSEIGALTSLQSLDLSRTLIHSLPIELGLLENLRYLHLMCSFRLRNIPNGLLCRLKMLRLLDLYRCHALKIDSSSGYIKELENLSRLRDIGFTVQDSDSLWKICNLRKASVRHLTITALVEGMQTLQISPLLLSNRSAVRIEALSLEHYDLLEELVIGHTDIDQDWCLPRLKTLVLHQLQALQTVIFKGVRSNTCLPSLRSLSILHCPNMTSITWIKRLSCLEDVYLGHCDSMVELVGNDEEATSSPPGSFPRLRFIAAHNLKNLHSICDSRITFLSLKRLLVYACPMLVKLPNNIVSGKSSLPLIIGEQKWWEILEWEDTSSPSSRVPSFRALPAGFTGRQQKVFRALYD